MIWYLQDRGNAEPIGEEHSLASMGQNIDIDFGCKTSEQWDAKIL